jgi:hypothetical protein
VVSRASVAACGAVSTGAKVDAGLKVLGVRHKFVVAGFPVVAMINVVSGGIVDTGATVRTGSIVL